MIDGDNFKVFAHVELMADCPNCGVKMFQPFAILSTRDISICPSCENVYKLGFRKLPDKEIDKKQLVKAIKKYRESD